MITNITQLDLSKRYTYADYLTWQFSEAVELIKGKVFKMSPAPSARHQEVAFNLSVEIGNALKGSTCKAFAAPFDVRLLAQEEAVETVVQPDLCVICDLTKIDNKGCAGAPDLIIEILSPSTATKDVNEKYALYEESGVKEYWLLHPHEETALPYTLQADGKYQAGRLHGPKEMLKSVFIANLNVSLTEAFSH